jgi:hypothetical protein
VDKNKIRAKIEERKRKIDEKNQVLQEAVKWRCLQEDQKHLYITNPAPNRRQRIRPCRLLTHEPLDPAKNQYEPFDRSHSGSLTPKCSMNSYSSLRDLNNNCSTQVLQLLFGGEGVHIFQFKWDGVFKSVSNTLIGASLEFEIALHTLLLWWRGK